MDHLIFLRDQTHSLRDKIPHLTDISNGDSHKGVVIECSRYGYHTRSNSPTYRRLINAKEQLDVALCKKLRAVRRQLEGQTARENSAIDMGLRLALDDRKSDEWYTEMIKKEFENEEQDDEMIDNMTVVNNEPLRGFQCLDVSCPRPHVELRFASQYLQAHINDWDILNIDVEAEEKKARERREKEKRRRPVRARSQSPTGYRGRPCEACCLGDGKVDKPRMEFLRTNRTRRVKFRRRKEDDDEDSDDSGDDLLPVMLHEMSFEPREVLPPPTNSKKPKKKSRSVQSKSSKSSKSKSSSKDTVSDAEENGISKEREDIGDTDPAISLVTESSLPAISDSRPLSALSVNDKSSVKSKTPSPEPPKLTEKEKFLLMRKRMEERQREKLEKRDSFIDYSMIAFTGSRKDRAGRGEKGLGSTLSERLDSMASFKVKNRGGRKGLMAMISSDDDDDDDDEEEDDDDDDGD